MPPSVAAPRAATRATFEPEARLPADFAERAGRLARRLSAASERREGRGDALATGDGEEFVGFRPYSAGDDLRRLDPDLLARLDRPFVRVTKRESSERWVVLIDASASMGVGPPGKLSLAAQVAAGLAHVALLGARGGIRGALLAASGPAAAPRWSELRIGRRTDLAQVVAFARGLRAEGDVSLAQLGVRGAALVRTAGRVFVIGDLLGVEPRALLELARRGRSLCAVQVLAPAEFVPALGPAEWLDPESGERLVLDVDEAARARYCRALEERLEVWRSTCARHRVRHACRASDEAFEDVVLEAVRT